MVMNNISKGGGGQHRIRKNEIPIHAFKEMP